MTDRIFTSGDVVCLKSGSCNMTVNGYEKDTLVVNVIYFTPVTNELIRTKLYQHELKHASGLPDVPATAQLLRKTGVNNVPTSSL